MKTFIILIMYLSLSGCAVGPFVLEHEYGKLPKARINLPEGKGDVKVRGNLDEVNLIWIRKFK